MKLILRANLIFDADDEFADEALRFLTRLTERYRRFTPPSGDERSTQTSRISFELCHHDELETTPCEVLEHWEL